MKQKTYLDELLENKEFKKMFDEEHTALTMLENDYIVKMPPNKRYAIELEITNIKKGEPNLPMRHYPKKSP